MIIYSNNCAGRYQLGTTIPVRLDSPLDITETTTTTSTKKKRKVEQNAFSRFYAFTRMDLDEFVRLLVNNGRF